MRRAGEQKMASRSPHRGPARRSSLTVQLTSQCLGRASRCTARRQRSSGPGTSSCARNIPCASQREDPGRSTSPPHATIASSRSCESSSPISSPAPLKLTPLRCSVRGCSRNHRVAWDHLLKTTSELVEPGEQMILGALQDRESSSPISATAPLTLTPLRCSVRDARGIGAFLRSRWKLVLPV